LAVAYVSNGYHYYVVGLVPEGKQPERVDAKLIDRYRIDQSKWQRARRKRRGAASVQYLRLGRRFVLLATHGEHPFFDLEGDRVRDVRRVPLKLFGYSVGYSGGHVRVRIERELFKRIRAHVLDLAVHRSSRGLADELRRLDFEPYGPVRRQLVQLVRAVNRRRRAAGYDPVPLDVLPWKRRLRRAFAQDHAGRALQPSGGARGLQYDSADGLDGDRGQRPGAATMQTG
jgi:hypothetical protein